MENLDVLYEILLSLGVGVRRKSYQSCHVLHGNHTGFQGEDLALGGLEVCSVARV